MEKIPSEKADITQVEQVEQVQEESVDPEFEKKTMQVLCQPLIPTLI
jgi:hypothetical protein